MSEYTVRDKNAKIVTIVPEFDLAFRYLKHHQPDGEYSVIGPECDCTITRTDGILYPTSGTIKGVRVEPRQNDEAREFFGHDAPRASSMDLISGEVWNHQGKVAGAIPAIPRPDGIPFRMIRFHPATDQSPDWVDMFVGDKPVRINPEISQPPYYRLFDCVAYVHLNGRKIRNLPIGNGASQMLQGRAFRFWYEKKLGCIMVDTQDRIDRWHNRDGGLLSDG